MKLLVQPDDGVAPLLEAIEGAKTSIDDPRGGGS